MGFLLETDHDSGIRARAPCEFGFGLIDFYIWKEVEPGNYTQNAFSFYSIFGDSVVGIKFRISRDFL
ncbi:hypothetical protein [Leptospira kirschneri]|uniref:hypothetical protein n=1 Tax=Leptospira kirschneri TaxID=29507 RepID=UPI00046C5881|nr:hypothetical protein [Leptospira kirschneri]